MLSALRKLPDVVRRYTITTVPLERQAHMRAKWVSAKPRPTKITGARVGSPEHLPGPAAHRELAAAAGRIYRGSTANSGYSFTRTCSSRPAPNVFPTNFSSLLAATPEEGFVHWRATGAKLLEQKIDDAHGVHQIRRVEGRARSKVKKVRVSGIR